MITTDMMLIIIWFMMMSRMSIQGKQYSLNPVKILCRHICMGGYAVATVLGMEHNVKAVVAASGLDTPEEQWQYSVNKYTGFFYSIIKPFNSLFISLKYGTDKSLSAVDGINNVSIPVMVISAEIWWDDINAKLNQLRYWLFDEG